MVALGVGLALLALAFSLFARMVIIAGLLFAWASDQGFVGVAAYIACWVFMFPIMVAVCLIGALFYSFDEEPAPSSITLRDDDDWDRRYEEAKHKRLAMRGQEATNNNDD
jgi:hypothetical protein